MIVPISRGVARGDRCEKLSETEADIEAESGLEEVANEVNVVGTVKAGSMTAFRLLLRALRVFLLVPVGLLVGFEEDELPLRPKARPMVPFAEAM